MRYLAATLLKGLPVFKKKRILYETLNKWGSGYPRFLATAFD